VQKQHKTRFKIHDSFPIRLLKRRALCDCVGKSFSTLLNHLYGGMDEPELKIIDVFICKLRKKLSEATGDENYIETVWGRGYVLRDPEPGRDQQSALAANG
jgi:hypothetical protein